jgi:hypothetical protein
MLKQIFSIFDTKAKIYLPLVAFNAEGEAVRTFADGLEDKTHPMGKHPEDYTLFRFGQFDDLTGAFTLLSAPEPVYNGLQIINNAEANNEEPTISKP